MIGKFAGAAGGVAFGLVGALAIGWATPAGSQNAPWPALPVGLQPPGPIIVVGGDMASSGTMRRTTFKRIPAQEESEILLYFNLDDSCRSLNYQVSVTRPAKFGIIRLGKREFKEIGRFKESIAASKPDDPRRKCALSGNEAKLVSYIPMDSHPGKDSFKVTIKDHGLINEIEIEVGV